jgi:AcrR family transcriptional regulator
MTVSRTATRSYSSTLRADQQEQVRERILVKVGEVLADPEIAELSVAEVARRTGVSVRTVYRYFPTKEALSDGFNESLVRRFGQRKLPDDLDELPHAVTALHRGFDEHAELVRAMRFNKPAVEVRARRKVVQRKAFTKMLAEHTAHLDEAEARSVGALFNILMSSELWLAMTDDWGVTTSQATKAVLWAFDALRARLERDAARRR